MKKIYPLFVFCFLITYFLQAQQVWDNFEDIRKGTYGFVAGSFTPYFENPDQTGANTSLIAAQYTRNPAETFDVIILDALMADLSDYVSGTKQISIDVWSPAPDKVVQITLENDQLALPANFPTGRHSVYLATTTVANAWETLTFTFDNQPDATVADDNVNRIVLLFDPNSNNSDTYYWDNLAAPELANDPCDGVTSDPNVFNDFECNQNVNFVFSHAGVNFRRVVNPDQNGNTSDYAATYTRNSGETNDVIIGRFDGNLALNSNSRITLDIWDPNTPTRVVVSLQNANGDVIIEMSDTTSTSSAWETLTFDPSSVAAATDISQFVILFDPDSNTSDQYFFDNFQLTGTTSIRDLAAVRSFTTYPNPSRGTTTFDYELESAARVSLTIQDLTGKVVSRVLEERQQAGEHRVAWEADQVANGIYFYTLSVNGKIATGKIAVQR